jgi:hypothetical protein
MLFKIQHDLNIDFNRQQYRTPNDSRTRGKKKRFYTRKIKHGYLKRRKTKDSGLLIPEEEQTTQWPKLKVQKDKQRSTKHTYKTKDRVTRTALKTGGEVSHCPFGIFKLFLKI